MSIKQPEAQRLAEYIYDLMDGSMVNYDIDDLEKVAAELLTQHSRITELESQLAQRFDAADMAAAAAQGFGDGAASVSAGREPVATVFTMDALTPGGGVKYHATIHKALPAGTKLYAHPSPSDGMAGWTTLPGRMPEPNTPVLLDIGKKFPIRALWAEKHTVCVGIDVDDWGEYVEEDDMYYAPEGWYEWNEHEEVHWAVSETPRAWAPLPPTTPAGSGNGE